ncbi:MAG: hypothetical protein Q7S36_03730 [Candidatus Liptonbacteria bacterium]|nr:hypothetical protein [Candidatus Liptonbacteria bacterium]
MNLEELGRSAKEATAEAKTADYFKKEIEISEKHKLEFLTGEAINLFFHTLNVYGLLGLHGKTYKSGDSADAGLSSVLKEESEGRDDRFEGLVRKLVEADPKTPEELFAVFSADKYETALSEALKKSWESFYGDYWIKNREKLMNNFASLTISNNWTEEAGKMEKLSGSKLETDFYLVGAEALAQSGMYAKPNISIGSMEHSSFFHEGMHLLLKEKWAEDPRIKSLMPDNWHDPEMWGNSWQQKFEQAVVVALDSLGKNMTKEKSYMYFDGCLVGDIKDFFYEPLKNWYEQKMLGKEAEKLEDVIYEILSTNKSELIDKFCNQK